MELTFKNGDSTPLDFYDGHLQGMVGGHLVKWDLDGDVLNKDELPEWVIEMAESADI